MSGLNARLHAATTGGVPGLAFRQFVVRDALLQVTVGRARNRTDGSVEVFARGPLSSLEVSVTVLRRGPERSGNESFELRSGEPPRAYRRSSIHST